jgi:hypothetical protein
MIIDVNLKIVDWVWEHDFWREIFLKWLISRSTIWRNFYYLKHSKMNDFNRKSSSEYPLIFNLRKLAHLTFLFNANFNRHMSFDLLMLLEYFIYPMSFKQIYTCFFLSDSCWHYRYRYRWLFPSTRFLMKKFKSSYLVLQDNRRRKKKDRTIFIVILLTQSIVIISLKKTI